MSAKGGIAGRLARIMNRAVAHASWRVHVAVANLWRDNYNPLRGLTIARAVGMLEDGERGAYAELQWTYRFIEMQDATIGALVERRTSAVQQLSWDIKVSDRVPEAKKAVAEKQAAALRAAYDRIENLTAALEFLEMAAFRGFCHLEMIENTAGEVTRFEPVDQWFWVREGMYGPWRMNRNTTFGTTRGEDVDMSRFITREVARPINRVALIAFIRKNLSQKDWDAWIETYGVPAVFIIMPPNVPAGKEDEYLEEAEKVASDARGALPNGSDVKSVAPGGQGTSPFKSHLDYQDQQIVMRGTGGLLTMLAQSGSGTLAGNAHADTFAAIAKAEAAEISEVLRARFDRRVIETVTPGEPAWAYFELAANEETDTKAITEDVARLKNAGYQVDAKWIAERTGYPVDAREVRTGDQSRESAIMNRGEHAKSFGEWIAEARRKPGAEDAQADRGASAAEELDPEIAAAHARILKRWGETMWRAAEAGDTAALAAAIEKATEGETDDGGLADALEELLVEQFAKGWEEEDGADNAPVRNTGTRDGAIKGWETRRANGWVAAPRLITPQAADEELDRGFHVTNQDGERIRFGIELKKKLDEKVVNDVDRAARKQRLPWAKLAVAEGAKETKTRKGSLRTLYTKTFRKGSKHQDVTVIVDTINGYAWNIMVQGGDPNAIR